MMFYLPAEDPRRSGAAFAIVLFVTLACCEAMSEVQRIQAAGKLLSKQGSLLAAKSPYRSAFTVLRYTQCVL